MPEVKWQFRKMSPAEKNHESVEREFFQEENINVRLVREVIQNSLDAALSKERPPGSGAASPVRVRFSLAGIANPLPESQAAGYFAGLAPHLRTLNDLDNAIQDRLERGSLVSGGVPYIVVEDDRTRGLNGDWRQFDDSPDNPAQGNDFYWFFRNTGRSGKGATDNGSWGLGKWVFPDASHISTCLALTRRSTDNDLLLMGMAVLNKHTIDGQRYPPDGYFAVHREDGFQQPLEMSNPEHALFIRQCIADFDLRFRANSGLSIIIPFPRFGSGAAGDELDKEGLLASVVRNYFYPIISGQLEVIVDGGDGAPPATLSESTVDSYLTDLKLGDTAEHSAQSYQKLFRMCREIDTLPPGECINLSQPPRNDPGYVHYDELVARRDAYAAGQLLAFRVETDVQRKGAEPESTGFDLYLQRDDTLPEGHDYYVRGTLSIPGMDYIGRYRARALLVVRETESLAAMLRDSEPPAHNTWRLHVDRVAKRWVAAPRRIDAVRSAPSRLLGILESPQEGLQKDALADIFFWDGKWGEDIPPPPPPKPCPGPGPGPNPPPPPPKPLNPPDFTVEQVSTQDSGGFRVKLPAGGKETGPLTARLQVAYVVPRGNPLKHYQAQDFRLHGPESPDLPQPLAVAVAGGSPSLGNAGNELLLTIDDPANFALTVAGFDPRRDVHIRVERVVAVAAEEE